MTDFNEDQIKSALIKSNGWNGGGVLNTPLNLTYSFGGNGIPYWHGIDYFLGRIVSGTFDSLSLGQKAVFEAEVKLWMNIANIDLKPITPDTAYTITTGSTTFADGTWNFEPESGEVSAVSPA